ncbi:MAG: hypothetical protein ACRELF_09055 [Gemmataceae bacterium]
MPGENSRSGGPDSERLSELGNTGRWKKFGLFSCGEQEGVPFLNFEILWTPLLAGRLSSHAWLDDKNWKHFIETAEVGEVFDGKGVLIVVRLKEAASDYEQ